MKVNVEVDFDDFFESFDSTTIVQALQSEVLEQIKARMKRHPSYKAYLDKQAEIAVKELTK